MNFKGYDLALITDEKERLYFLGFHSTAGYVMIAPDKTVFAVDNRYFHAAERALKPKGITVVSCPDDTALKNLCEDRGVKTIAVDYTKITVSEMERLKALGYNYVDCSSEIAEIMAIKTQTELKYLAKACDIAEKAWKATLPFIKAGVTEREVANELEYNFKKFGASGTSFDTIVAFGKNAAVPHHETGETKLKDNECVLMDFGCLYKGYCSDMTRTMFYGKPTKEFLKAYDAVLTAHEKAALEIREGMTGKEADAVARNVLIDLGYGEYFTHSLGHGIGVNIHEFPTLSPKSEWVIKNNMVFSNEPGVYLNGKFGIRLEDSAYLSDGKYKTFMKDDKSLIVLNGGKARKRKTTHLKQQ